MEEINKKKQKQLLPGNICLDEERENLLVHLNGFKPLIQQTSAPLLEKQSDSGFQLTLTLVFNQRVLKASKTCWFLIS